MAGSCFCGGLQQAGINRGISQNCRLPVRGYRTWCPPAGFFCLRRMRGSPSPAQQVAYSAPIARQQTGGERGGQFRPVSLPHVFHKLRMAEQQGADIAHQVLTGQIVLRRNQHDHRAGDHAALFIKRRSQPDIAQPAMPDTFVMRRPSVRVRPVAPRLPLRKPLFMRFSGTCQV